MSRVIALAVLGTALGLSIARAAEPPPLKAYAADPAIEGVDVSPSGGELAFIKADSGKRAVILLPAADQSAVELNAGSTDLSKVQWLDDLHLLIVKSAVMDVGGVLPRQQVHQGVSYNVKTNHAAIVLNGSELALNVVTDGHLVRGVYRGRSVLYLRGLELAPQPKFSLYAADAETGRGVRLDGGSFNSTSWAVAPDGTVLARERFAPSSHTETIEVDGPQGWRSIERRTGVPADLVGLGHIPQTVLLWRDPDFLEIDTATGRESAPLRPGGKSPLAAILNPATNALVALAVSADTPSYVFYDPAFEVAWKAAAGAFPGKRVHLCSFSKNYRELAVEVEGPGDPGTYYWVHLGSGRAEEIGAVRPGIKSEQVGPLSAIEFNAKDGLPLTGYVTLPPGRAPKNLPLVVLVHDGPNGRDTLTFDPTAQALASRGYAVLKVNYRGSTGVSDALQAAGLGELGRAMQTDLSDGVAYLAGRGVIDPKRACIMGEGYGGYAALAGVTLQSGVYRCAISVDGIGDVPEEIRSPDKEERSTRWVRVALWRRYIGVAGADDPRARSISPVSLADRATAPILLISDDWEELLSQTNVTYGALSRAKKPVERVLLKGTEHQLITSAGREQMLEAALAFLAKNNPP